MFRAIFQDRSQSVAGAIAAAIVCWLLVYVGLALATSRSIVATLAEYPSFLLVFIGAALLRLGAPRRVGDSLHCARCGYQRAPVGANGPRCAECGADWDRPGGLVRGRRALRGGCLVSGLLLAGGGIAMAAFPLRTVGRLTPYILPSSALIREVTGPHGATAVEEWAELKRRELSTAQRRQLAEGLLARRLAEGGLGREDDAWFSAQIQQKRLPEDLQHRYCREAFDFWLDCPPAVRAGETVEAGIGVVNRRPVGSIGDWFVIVESFEVDGVAVEQARSTRPLFATIFGRTRRQGQRSSGPAVSEYNPRVQLAPEAPGEVRLRAVVWLLVGASQELRNELSWDERGAPLLPPGVRWHERIELERRILVTP